MLFKIPRVAVHIPGETSLTKFVPEYEYPLFLRQRRGRIADPGGDPLRVIPHPAGSGYPEFWYEVEAESVSELIQAESLRLRAMFGTDARLGDSVFDVVYPGDQFAQSLDKALESAKTHETNPLRADPSDKILPLCEAVGLDRFVAKRLVQVGWTDAEKLESADVDQLAKITGKVRGLALIKAAQESIYALVNATAAEQIAGTKVAKAKKD